MRTPLMSPQRRVRPSSVRLPRRAATEAENIHGATLMLIAMAAFACNDATMKYVAQTLPLYQAIALRGALVMIALPLIFLGRGGVDLRVSRADWPALALRTVGEVSSTLLFLNALHHMPIGELSAIMQALPLLVMLAAAVFFREPLGWRRMVAVVVGLMGVMLILRPGSMSFTLWSVVALGSVAGVVVRDLATRLLGPALKSNTIAFYAALAVTVSALLMSLGEGWQTPTATEGGLLVLTGGFLSLGYLTVVATMRVGDVGFVAPFRYTSLVFAMLLGAVIFAERPGLWTLAGAALVVAAGLYSIWRERQLRGGAG